MKSFLKWAGNKHRILDKLKSYLPKANRLIEPFLGSATVFLNTSYHAYLLGDSNLDLIQLYKYLQQEGQLFIDYFSLFPACQLFRHGIEESNKSFLISSNYGIADTFQGSRKPFFSFF